MEIRFINGGSYWPGTTLHFSGKSARYFFILIQQKLVPWQLFYSATLGRFDLYYSRKNKSQDNIYIEDFLQNCQQELKQTNKNSRLAKNSTG